MSEPVFFKRGPGLTVADIAALTGAKADSALAARRVVNIAALDRAGPGDLTFAETAADESALRGTRAGACFLRGALAKSASAGVATLIVDDPFQAFVMAASALYPDSARPSSLYDMQGRANSALVHPTARLETGVTLDPAAVVGPRAEIGGGTLVGPMVVVGPDVRIGRDCALGAGVSLTHALVGDRVTIHAGSRIGESGLGGARNTPPVGRVIIQDGVEIGANCTIDRGRLGDTVIGEGAKIENLMRIAPDTTIDRHCVIVPPAGLSGAKASP
jgi:UDP-3-O-[3-hydroxymyristoyl] glucosamine N-acyltransferase